MPSVDLALDLAPGNGPARNRWSPAFLFEAGEQGFWLDPSHLSSMFQDAAGTTPAAVDQPVGLIRDRSGRNNHASQSTADSRPVLRHSGGLYYLEFDGTDDFLVTGSIDFTGGDAISVFAGVHKASDAAIGSVVGLSSAPQTNSGTFELFAPGTSGQPTLSFRSRGSASSTPAPSGHAAPLTKVLTGLADISADQATLRVNGTATTAATDQGTGNYSNAAGYIGRRGGASNAFNGRLYGLAVRAGLTSGARLRQAEAWMATKAGVSW